MSSELGWGDRYNSESSWVSPCGEQCCVVEDRAKRDGFERFVVLTCDYKVMLQGVLEANHCSDSEFGVCGVGWFDFLQV